MNICNNGYMNSKIDMDINITTITTMKTNITINLNKNMYE